MDQLDPTIVNLARSIKQAETGSRPDAYTAVGDNGTSYGAYQFQPATWQTLAQKHLGDPNAQKSIVNQNKIAYNQIKEWKDQGYNPAQIASMWNSGRPDAYKDGTGVGHNDKLNVDFNVPEYAAKVSSFYRNLSSGNKIDATTEATPPTTPTGDTSSPTEPHKSFGQKVINTLGDISGQRGLGEDIGGFLAEGHNQKLFNEADQQHNQIAADLATRIKQKEDNGEDATRLKKALQQIVNDSPKLKEFLPNVTSKTGAQIMADIAQSGLAFVGAGSLLNASTTLGRIGVGAGVGAGAGGLSAIQSGDTNAGDIAKNAAIGAVVGGAIPAAVEGVGALAKGVSKKIGNFFGSGKTAQELRDLASDPNFTEKDAAKLSVDEQAKYYQAKSELVKAETTKQKSIADEYFQNEEDYLKKAIPEQGARISESANKTVEDNNLVERGRQYLTDKSNQYVSEVNKAIETASANGFETSIPTEKASAQIDGVLKNDPTNELANEIKSDLGIGTEGKAAVTVDELIAKAKEYSSQVSKSSFSGNKSFSSSEYKLMQKYGAIMDVLQENGVDLSKANAVWRESSAMRKSIVTQLRPFDNEAGTELNKKPITRTLIRANNTTNTAIQAAAKKDAQKLVAQLEKELGFPEGSLGKDISEEISKLDGLKLDKTDNKRIAKEVKEAISEEGGLTKQDISDQKHDAKMVAQNRAKIKRIILYAAAIVGLSKGKDVIHAVLP